MKTLRMVCRAVPVGMLLALCSATQGSVITYSTMGIFSGGSMAGSDEFLDTADGVSILFAGSGSDTVTAPPTSFVTFGTFETASTATSPIPVTSNFTLDIFQTSPTVGTSTFVGALNGTLEVSNSQEFVQFQTPLSTTIDSVLYTLEAYSGGVAGRVNLAAPSSNFGLTTLNGTVGVSSVPEPATLGIAAMGAVSLLRRRRTSASA